MELTYHRGDRSAGGPLARRWAVNLLGFLEFRRNTGLLSPCSSSRRPDRFVYLAGVVWFIAVGTGAPSFRRLPGKHGDVPMIVGGEPGG